MFVLSILSHLEQHALPLITITCPRIDVFVTVIATHSEQYPGPEFSQLPKSSLQAEIFVFPGCVGIKINLLT